MEESRSVRAPDGSGCSRLGCFNMRSGGDTTVVEVQEGSEVLLLHEQHVGVEGGVEGVVIDVGIGQPGPRVDVGHPQCGLHTDERRPGRLR